MNAARKKAPKEDAWVSLHAAAVALGVTRHSVLQRALAGELVTEYVAGRTVVSRLSITQALEAKAAAAPND